MAVTFLSNKDSKKIVEDIEERWGCDLKVILKEYSFNITDKKKVHLFKRQPSTINLQSLYPTTVGIYVASTKDKGVRLTVEGSQLIGPLATKNVLEITVEQAQQWIRGNDLTVEGTGLTIDGSNQTADDRRDNRLPVTSRQPPVTNGFVIIKCNTDFMGCGCLKENTILNYLAKTRRIHSSD